ncbi:hypothetical protein ACFQ3R_03590 [Mesonia ostreae]|uniref:Uncharacterized protein n=1 Tax=Mesonia ostreae TaxID=861110 RepID=A0ABU2KJ75_9FLAO|nr:hypothetical protein [Mesonia ostreae]MDT0294768.1 hypothetical protein [Mesonia ostreae]
MEVILKKSKFGEIALLLLSLSVMLGLFAVVYIGKNSIELSAFFGAIFQLFIIPLVVAPFIVFILVTILWVRKKTTVSLLLGLSTLFLVISIYLNYLIFTS